MHIGAGQGALSRGAAADHLGQWAAVRGEGLQGVDPPVGHVPRAHLAPLAFMGGQAPAIRAARDAKLEAAREQRRQRRQEQATA